MSHIRFDDPNIVTITHKPAGPLVVEGAVVFLDNEGQPIEPPPAKIPGQIKLCGCGMSGTKPFCDGSHKR
jgi:CDGSH-type Zn-finger protein